MSYFFKIAAVGIVTAVLILLIRKQNADVALLVSVVSVVLILVGAISFLTPVIQYMNYLQSLCRIDTAVLTPLFKVIAVGIVCQITGGICTDAGQQAMAKAIELCGTIVALYAALPLVKAVFTLFESILQGG